MADNKVNFLRGTSAEYEAKTKDNDTFYYTTDDKKLYLGETKITGIEIDDTSTTTIDKTWSAKKINDSIPTELPANGGNADTVDGYHESDFTRVVSFGSTSTDLNTTYGEAGRTMIYKCTKWTNYPSGLANGQGTLIVMNWQNNSSGIYCRQIFTPAGGSTKIFQRTISGTPSNLIVNPWTNIADGGNADTFAENSIDKFLKYNGIATDCNECTTRGVYQTTSSTLNTPSLFLLTDRTPILITFDGSFQLFFTGVELYSRAYCIDPYEVNSPHWSDWTNVADGGNAKTVGGKSLSDLMVWGMSYDERTKITSGDLNDYTAVGSYVVTAADVAATIANSPWTNTGYFLDVYYRTEGYCVQIAMTWNGAIKIRFCSAGAWNKDGWKNIADGGNAATVNGLTVQTAVPANAKFTDTTYPAASVSAAGLVTTGSQTFAGSKTFQETMHIRHPAYTKGSTAPSTIQFRAYRFLDNANKQVGEFSNYVDTNNNTVSKMLAVAANSLDGKIYSQIATLINADASYICHVCTTPTTGRSSLRQMASGTAEATTSNCPSGAWYGRHS